MTSKTHECSACGGDGVVHLFEHCIVCDGSGRISDRLPVADALADAETLRECWRDWHYLPDEGEWVSFVELVDQTEARLWLGGTLGLGGYLPWECADSAYDAARAAFRAVPGLREAK